MKVVAALQADLDHTPLGTRSRLSEPLAGSTVLRRTTERLARAESLSGVYVLCPTAQHERCSALLAGTPAVVRPFDAPPAPWAMLMQSARKWSLDAWRGGLGGATHFDEFTDPRLLHGLLQQEKADAVLSVSPAAVLVDPRLADRMVRHFERNRDDAKLTFAQTPTGLSGIVLDATVLEELAGTSTPVGWTLSYKPDNPQKDLAFSSCCFEVPADVRYAVGRLTVDTGRATRRVKALLEAHDAPDAETIGRWLRSQEAAITEPLPREVEIELTTDDPYPDALLRPRGARVERRGPIKADVVGSIVAELTRFDDALVVLGGFGDPLRHPAFGTILAAIRSAGDAGAGPYGLAVRSTGVDLTDEVIELLFAHHVDVLTVTLDAWTPELYARLQSPDGTVPADLNGVCKKLDRLAQRAQQRSSACPIIVPEMVKARDNVHELNDFYDGWIRRLGAVTISGYSHLAGQCEDRSVMSMSPSPREGCRRLRSRCFILADGRMTLCDQDFNGRHAVGRVGEHTLAQLWQGPDFERVRAAHRRRRFDPTPLCAVCDEWHRP